MGAVQSPLSNGPHTLILLKFLSLPLDVVSCIAGFEKKKRYDCYEVARSTWVDLNQRFHHIRYCTKPQKNVSHSVMVHCEKLSIPNRTKFTKYSRYSTRKIVDLLKFFLNNKRYLCECLE